MSTEITPISIADLERIVEVDEQDLLVIGKADGTKSFAIRYDVFMEKLQRKEEKGQPDGYAPLDEDGKVPEEHLPDGLNVNLANSDLTQTQANRSYDVLPGQNLRMNAGLASISLNNTDNTDSTIDLRQGAEYNDSYITINNEQIMLFAESNMITHLLNAGIVIKKDGSLSLFAFEALGMNTASGNSITVINSGISIKAYNNNEISVDHERVKIKNRNDAGWISLDKDGRISIKHADERDKFVYIDDNGSEVYLTAAEFKEKLGL